MFADITEPALRALVHRFYAAVRRDPALAPVFEAAIPEDAWPAHLEKMVAFWSSVMLTSGRYKGDPVASHRRAHAARAFPPELFARWLDLFEATAAALFAPAAAAAIVAKARQIAESLRLALFFRPDRRWEGDLRRRGDPRGDQTASASSMSSGADSRLVSSV
ncbi:MAG: group III truncated hemoglobin [Acetobacteraceae bacterium]